MNDFETQNEPSYVNLKWDGTEEQFRQLEAEVERLGQRVVEAETRRALSQRIKEREAEIGKLRAGLALQIGLLKQAEAEVERLRAALERIEDLDWHDGEDAAIKMQVEARAALAKEEA